MSGAIGVAVTASETLLSSASRFRLIDVVLCDLYIVQRPDTEKPHLG
jgi:hypothetical protein